MSKIPNVLKTFIRSISTKPAPDLKAILATKIETEREKVKKFRKDHGSKKIGEVTVDMIYGGMRGIKGLVCETSLLDPDEGIRFRGYSIRDIQEKLPKSRDGEQPVPEGIFWLMLTGELPTQSQVNWLSKQWAERSALPNHVEVLLSILPASLHPMAQLSCAITAIHHNSKFSKAYNRGIPKSKYWEYIYEDAMDLIGKIIVIAAIVFRNTYRARTPVSQVDPNKDWAYNFTQMLGYDSEDMIEFIRLYLTLHCDHEGGNVSAHATHLVGSALSDCYLSYAAGVNGLAGPLHGLANQEVLIWLQALRNELGDHVQDHQLSTYIRNTLASGKVIPGYGHAVLRQPDPRYLCLRDFCLRYLPDDPLFKLCSQSYKLIPSILMETGKVKNPWPNVDAHSGVVLQYYGLDEMEFYTVMFAVSRVLGAMASLIWSRGLGLPIERPKSMTTEAVMKAVADMK